MRFFFFASLSPFANTKAEKREMREVREIISLL